ncbi:MAG: hypothetical protein KAX49_16020 [Halanaerobiales bacterium]|nr:hypothetical protein [Halanaerobiales bacterium]
MEELIIVELQGSPNENVSRRFSEMGSLFYVKVISRKSVNPLNYKNLKLIMKLVIIKVIEKRRELELWGKMLRTKNW